jgi:hypothetical protein
VRASEIEQLQNKRFLAPFHPLTPTTPGFLAVGRSHVDESSDWVIHNDPPVRSLGPNVRASEIEQLQNKRLVIRQHHVVQFDVAVADGVGVEVGDGFGELTDGRGGLWGKR